MSILAAANPFALTTFQAYGFFSLIALLGLVAAVLLFLSIRAQRRYTRDALPVVPEFAPQVEIAVVSQEDNAPSVFAFDDEDDEPQGNIAASNLLKDVQRKTVKSSAPGKAAFNPFGSKK
jgi:hypothetical protein